MALTQISTGGVKNDAVTAGKIPANAVGSSEIADDAVGAAQIADDGVAQAAVADEAIDEARLQISNAGTNGQFLQKQSGNTGGLTWATVTVPDADKIEEGNTSVETIDTGSDGHVKITTEGTERVRIDENGLIGVNMTPQTSAGSTYMLQMSSGGTQCFMSLGNNTSGVGPDNGVVIGNDASNAYLWNREATPMQLGTSDLVRFQIGSSGQLGVGGATYGTSGQVLTSGGASAAPQWADAGGGNLVHVAGVSAPNSEYVTFTGLTSTNISSYLIRFNGITFSAGYESKIRAQLQFNGTWEQNSEYKTRISYFELGSSSNMSYSGSSATDFFNLQDQGGYQVNGEMHLPMCSLTNNDSDEAIKYCWGTMQASKFRNDFHGQCDSTASRSNQISGIRFRSNRNNDNIGESGRIDLYKYTY